ncbi:ABC transporter substrate-binding protein [Azospirillum soli]|uniref:ABC transporter substrate-binding protein n=1 Tax=Azospirillum soli TaxID=1304799 RepID=UPI001AE11F8D|nr:ABC transporter substrate-binding protein [Azospirillum soli]MBP2316687.1 NitT/TauT family transport system substrate-binding protein [Azospirillum soli]
MTRISALTRRLRLDVRPIVTAALVAGAALWTALPARADTPVKLTLDWAFQGPQAPFLLALERGYYKAEGLDVTIDRGEGSGAVPPRIAAGTYDIGFGDINPMIRFVAEKGADLVAVAVLYDASPLAAIATKKSGITSAKQLEGRTLAAPETDSARQIFPAFAKAAGIDPAKVSWQTVTPQLRETMLAQGKVDAITGFLTTGIFSLKAAGIPEGDIVTMRYRDAGVALYSNALITSRKFAEANPKAVAGFVKATLKAHIDAVRKPQAAIDALKKRDPLIDTKIELDRMKLAFDELMLSPEAKANGLSTVDPARFQKAIDILKETYAFPKDVKVADVYTDAYLPPVAERTLP